MVLIYIYIYLLCGCKTAKQTANPKIRPEAGYELDYNVLQTDLLWTLCAGCFYK